MSTEGIYDPEDFFCTIIDRERVLREPFVLLVNIGPDGEGQFNYRLRTSFATPAVFEALLQACRDIDGLPSVVELRTRIRQANIESN